MPDAEPELGELLLRELLDRVTRGDVADLVAEHARELRLRVEVREDARA